MSWEPLLLAALCAIFILPHAPVYAVPFFLGYFFPGARVIGGIDATLGQFPYHLQLRNDSNFLCGATLVECGGIQVAITAAHCVTWYPTTQPFDPNMVTLRAGIIGMNDEGQMRPVKTIKVHEDYTITSTYVINDIAILHFFDDFQLDDTVKPLALPGQDQPTTGEVTLTGWGLTQIGSEAKATTLQTVNLPVVESSQCNDWFSKEIGSPEIITDSMLCAGYETVEKRGCHGDSGGPAAGLDSAEPYLAGVVSWGFPTCEKLPTVFTRVSSYIDWINSNSR